MMIAGRIVVAASVYVCVCFVCCGYICVYICKNAECGTLKIIPFIYSEYLLCNKPLKNITARNNLSLLDLRWLWVRDSHRALQGRLAYLSSIMSGASA